MVAAIAVGGFARALHAQGEASALIAAQSNASIALEQMAREIRSGYLFCTSALSTLSNPMPDAVCGCVLLPGPGNGEPWTCSALVFTNAEGEGVTYSTGSGALTRNGSAITSGNVAVKYLTFTLFGQVPGDHWNPRITMAMGIAPSSTDPAIAGDVIRLETTVSARQADYTSSTPPQY